MRHEVRRKLDWELRKRNLRRAGFAVCALAVFAGALWFEGLDAKVVNRHVAGTVTDFEPFVGRSSQAIQEGLDVSVKLDESGHTVHVLALKTTHPQRGDHVEIVEHLHGSGRATYSWK